MPLLPRVESIGSAIPTLKIWQTIINPTLNLPVPPRSPFNFQANGGAAGATGNTLSWERVMGADGYEVQSSSNGDFSTSPIIVASTSSIGTSFFDSTTVTGVKRYYRLRSTAGIPRALHTIKGTWSAPISVTSGSGATTYDQVSGSTGNAGGNAGWNKGNNGGIGNRILNLQ